MKTTFLLLLISFCSYGQIDTTNVTGETFINLKFLDSSYIDSNLKIKFAPPLYLEKLEKQYWNEKKQVLSKLLGDFIKEEEIKEKNLVEFYKWLNK